MCLVVDGIGKPREQLPIKGTDDDYVLDLAESILHMIADQVAPADINFWKPLSFDKSPQDTHSARVKDFLEAPDHRGAVLMAKDEQLRVYFPPDQLFPPDYIHIIAQLPASEKDLGEGIFFGSSNAGLTSILQQTNLLDCSGLWIGTCLLNRRSLSPYLLKRSFRFLGSPI
jgi:hypothetical protein